MSDLYRVPRVVSGGVLNPETEALKGIRKLPRGIPDLLAEGMLPVIKERILQAQIQTGATIQDMLRCYTQIPVSGHSKWLIRGGGQ